MVTDRDWTRHEVEVIVADYLQMLAKELSGTRYNKTQHRRELLPKLNGRTSGSVEFKHRNISAVLRDSNRPFIAGYKPRANLQEIIKEVVDEQWISFVVTPVDSEESDWLSDVASCVGQLGKEFGLSEVYAYEDALRQLHPHNDTVRAKVRQILQRLRDKQAIAFVDNSGRYRKTEIFPSGVELIRIEMNESEDPDDPPLDIPNDPKTRYLRPLRQRKGAPRFRRALLRLYESRCAITGDGPVEVLEAAHIEPHSEQGLNTLENGLLLRADIHTLFDLDLLWIDPENMSVRTASGLQSTTYASLDGKPLRKRKNGTHPSAKLLQERNSTR